MLLALMPLPKVVTIVGRQALPDSEDCWVLTIADRCTVDMETADDPPTKASLRALLAKETDADKRIALRDQLLELEFPTAPTHPDTVLLPTTAMSLEAIPNPDPDPNPKARV